MASQGMTLRLDPGDLRNAINALMSGNRIARMTAQYGETVTVKEAAQILNRSRPTVYAMINDGRIRTADGRVDVQSMAQYLEDPKDADRRARFDKTYGKG